MAQTSETIKRLFELNEITKKQGKEFSKKRDVYQYITTSGKAFIGIAGLRGVGKTTILKQMLVENPKAIYISLDTFPNINLFDIARELEENHAINTLLLDEINYYPKWQMGLKNIYDFTNLKVYFTSSVAIDIINSKIDLSRRVIIKKVFPFSFREYLYFNKGKQMEKLTIKDINNQNKLKEINRYDYLFEDYVSGGNIPAQLQERDPEIFKNILEKILEKDLVYSLKFTGEDIINVRNMLEFISNSNIDDMSYTNIAKNIGISRYWTTKYVEALEKAFVLNVVKPEGSNVSKEPKIMLVPPFRLCYLKNKDFKDVLGQLREEFFVESAKMNNISIFYIKGNRGEKKPDYSATINKTNFVFEVGGKNKTRMQIIKYESGNKYILTQPANIKNPYRPLIIFGFL